MEVNFKIYGLRELEDLMVRKLPIKAARSSLLQGMRLSFNPMIKAAQDKVVKKSYALALSLGMKTVPNRGGNKAFAAMVGGPMRNEPIAIAAYAAHYRRGNLTKESTDGFPGIRHGHLVEWGFKHKNGKHVPAQPFMRPAFDSEVMGYIGTFNRNVEMKVNAAIDKHNRGSPAARRSR